MQSGELIVTGKDEAKVALHGFPTKVKVSFKDDCDIIPCNPHHHDDLEWEVHHSVHHHGGFVLVIRWHVTSVREIAWTAWF